MSWARGRYPSRARIYSGEFIKFYAFSYIYQHMHVQRLEFTRVHASSVICEFMVGSRSQREFLCTYINSARLWAYLTRYIQRIRNAALLWQALIQANEVLPTFRIRSCEHGLFIPHCRAKRFRHKIHVRTFVVFIRLSSLLVHHVRGFLCYLFLRVQKLIFEALKCCSNWVFVIIVLCQHLF